MVIAIGVNRIVLGLSIAFGLAVVLIVLGLLLMRSRSWSALVAVAADGAAPSRGTARAS